jgi:hypothetical protein
VYPFDVHDGSVVSVQLGPARLRYALWGCMWTVLGCIVSYALLDGLRALPVWLCVGITVVVSLCIIVSLVVAAGFISWEVDRGGLRHAVVRFIYIRWNDIRSVVPLSGWPEKMLICSVWVFPRVPVAVPARYMLRNRQTTCAELFRLYDEIKDFLPPNGVKFFQMYCAEQMRRGEAQGERRNG